MAIQHVTVDDKFKDLVASKSGDFKKIINKAVSDLGAHGDNGYAYSVIKAKCDMDFYEDMNMEVSRDSQ